MGTPMTRIERINADYFTPFVFFVAWWEIIRIRTDLIRCAKKDGNADDAD